MKKHEIRGRCIEVNKALARNSAVPEDVKTKGFRKLFVGGFGSEVQVHHLEEYFSNFGTVTNAYIILDPMSKASKSRTLSPDFGYLEFETMDQANSALNNGPHYLFGKRLTLEYQKNSRVAAYSLINESPAGTQTTQLSTQGAKNKTLRSHPLNQNEKVKPKHVEGHKIIKPSSKTNPNSSCRLAHGEPCLPLVTAFESNHNRGFFQNFETLDFVHADEQPTSQLLDTLEAPDSAFPQSAAAKFAKKPSLNESRMQEFYRHLRERTSNCSSGKIRSSLNKEVNESRNYRYNTERRDCSRGNKPSKFYLSKHSTQTPNNLTHHRPIYH